MERKNDLKKLVKILVIDFLFVVSIPKIGWGCGFQSNVPDVCIGTEIHFNDYTNMSKPAWKLYKGSIVIAQGQDDFSYTFTIPANYHIYLWSYASITTCGTYDKIFTVYDKLDGSTENISVCRNGSTINLENYRNQYGWLSGGTWSGTGVSGNYFDPSTVSSGTSSVTLNYSCYNPVCSPSTTTNQLNVTIIDPPVANFISGFPSLYQSDPAINILPYTDQNNADAWITGSGITNPDLFSPLVGPGDWTLTLHYQDPVSGCYSDPATQDIHVDADLGYPPPADISFYTLSNPNEPNQFICDGDSVFLQITDFDTSQYNYNISVISYNQYGQTNQLYNAIQLSNLFSFAIPDDGLNNDIKIIISNTNAQNKTTNKNVVVHSKAIPINPTFILSQAACMNNGDIVELNKNYDNMNDFYWNPTTRKYFEIINHRTYVYNNQIFPPYFINDDYSINFVGSCENISVSTQDNLTVNIYNSATQNIIYSEFPSCNSTDTINNLFSKTPDEPSLRFYDISDTSGTVFYVPDGKTFDVKINNYNSNYQYQKILIKNGNFGIIDTILNSPVNSQTFSITIPDDSLNNTVGLNFIVTNSQCGNCKTQQQYYFLSHAIPPEPNFNMSDSSCVSDTAYIYFQIDSALFGMYHILDFTPINDSSQVVGNRKIIVNNTDTINFNDTISILVSDTGQIVTAQYLDFLYDVKGYTMPPLSLPILRGIINMGRIDTLYVYKTPDLQTRFYDISDTSGTVFYVPDGKTFDVKINTYNSLYSYNKYLYQYNQFNILDTLDYTNLSSQLFSITIPDDSLNNTVGLQILVTNPYGGCQNIENYNFYSHAKAPKPDFINEDSTCVNDTVYILFNYNDTLFGYYNGSIFTNISDSNQIIEKRKIVINNQDTISIGDSTVVLMNNLENIVTAFFLDSIVDQKDSINTRTIYVTGRENNLILFHNPKPDFSVLDNNLFEGELLQFTNLSEFSQGYNSIYWNFGDNSFSLEDNPWHYYYISGNKDVTLTINNMYQCQSSNTKYAFITVNSNASNPINSSEQKGIKVTQDNENIFVYLPGEGYKCRLMSITGKIILEKNNTKEGLNREDITGLASGIYILSVTGKNSILTKKIIKK